MSKIVLGGGLSGLSAAYYLLRRFPTDKVTLLEGANSTGGWIRTRACEDGTFFELGPRTIRPRGAAASNTLHMIEDLGLGNEIYPITSSHPAAKNRMVYVNGKLHKLPSSLSGLFFKTPPLSQSIASTIAKEFTKPRRELDDESIYNFAERRFGREIADYFISPMICGICAGNAKEISVKFLMETLFDYEQKYGSITKGVIRSFFGKKVSNGQTTHSRLSNRVKNEHWSIYSFRNGMDTLPKHLTSFIQDNGVNVIYNSPCIDIEFKGKTVIVHSDASTYSTDHVISSLPAKQIAQILQKSNPNLSAMLNGIPTVDVAVVNLKFQGNLISNPGFGYLIPPKEQIPVLGVIFDSCSRQSTEVPSTVLTAMIGGHWFDKYLGPNPTEDHLLALTLEHIKETLNITDTPSSYKVSILRSCIPQYVVGHTENVKRIQDYIKSNNLPLSICGASYYGVGVNDVILSAKNAIQDI